MSVYSFWASCPLCAGHVDHLNGSALGSESVAVARCEPCAREWMVRVYLCPLDTPEQRAQRERKAARKGRLAGVGT